MKYCATDRYGRVIVKPTTLRLALLRAYRWSMQNQAEVMVEKGGTVTYAEWAGEGGTLKGGKSLVHLMAQRT